MGRNNIYALVLCYFYIIFIFIILHCPLRGPDLIYISLLIIPCIIYYVTNKETLNLEFTPKQTRRALKQDREDDSKRSETCVSSALTLCNNHIVLL